MFLMGSHSRSMSIRSSPMYIRLYRHPMQRPVVKLEGDVLRT